MEASKSFWYLYSCLSMHDVIVVTENIRLAYNLAQIFMCYVKSAVYLLVYIVQKARCAGIYKCISIYYGLCREICLYIWFKSFWCLYSCLSIHDMIIVTENMILSQFDTNFYVLCEVSCLLFGVQCAKSTVCRDVQKYLNTLRSMQGLHLLFKSFWCSYSCLSAYDVIAASEI